MIVVFRVNGGGTEEGLANLTARWLLEISLGYFDTTWHPQKTWWLFGRVVMALGI